MGIGVYESAQYVESLGGRIEVDSKPGAGTRVRLSLPALGHAAVSQASPRVAA
jgi:signal transduction histidine kinase